MLRTARTLNATQWRHFVEALVWLPRVDLRLRKHGYEGTKRWIDAKTPSMLDTSTLGTSAAFDADIAKAVSIASRRTLWPTSCLRQALVLRYFLARAGLESDIKIGVRKNENNEFAAHAWVIRNGVVLIGGEQSPQRYATMI